MPAVTVADITVLSRIPELAPHAEDRRVTSITTAPSGFEGEGFPVRRAFQGVDLRDLDPFVHMDQMGEVEYAPGEPKGTAWHPHRGFETVTYIMDGTFEHNDSHGGGGVITNGDTQWMTAGSGLLHIERPPESLVVSGGLFHGVQLWVNLPAAQKAVAPRYQDLRGAESALLSTPDGGALVRVIAGDLAGHEGPGSTYTPMAMMHATISPGSRLRLPWRSDFNALVYVLSGAGTVGCAGQPVSTGQLAVFGSGAAITVSGALHQESRHANLDVIVLGGAPIREPIAWAGPFVMNTRDEVLQAFEDYQAGRLGVIPTQSGSPTQEMDPAGTPAVPVSTRKSGPVADGDASAGQAALTDGMPGSCQDKAGQKGRVGAMRDWPADGRAVLDGAVVREGPRRDGRPHRCGRAAAR